MRIGRSRRSRNIEDYRGSRTGGGGMKFGLGTVAVLVVGYFLGINPMTMLGLLQGTQTGDGETAQPVTGAPTDEAADFVSAVLGETEDAWTTIFTANGAQYTPPTLVLFSQQINSGCGFATSGAGPFYCPADRKIYIDLAFYDELEREFDAPGDFARAYVLAHEVGHHVQTITGTSSQVRSAQQQASELERNQLQVKMELQADCYAGIWAHHADRQNQILEPGDIEEGLRAAAAVGDDTIQKRVQGHVQPDSFTHGSAEQRAEWFRRGYESGSVAACDTFNAG